MRPFLLAGITLVASAQDPATALTLRIRDHAQRSVLETRLAPGPGNPTFTLVVDPTLAPTRAWDLQTLDGLRLGQGTTLPTGQELKQLLALPALQPETLRLYQAFRQRPGRMDLAGTLFEKLARPIPSNSLGDEARFGMLAEVLDRILATGDPRDMVIHAPASTRLDIGQATSPGLRAVAGRHRARIEQAFQESPAAPFQTWCWLLTLDLQDDEGLVEAIRKVGLGFRNRPLLWPSLNVHINLETLKVRKETRLGLHDLAWDQLQAHPFWSHASSYPSPFLQEVRTWSAHYQGWLKTTDAKGRLKAVEDACAFGPLAWTVDRKSPAGIKVWQVAKRRVAWSCPSYLAEGRSLGWDHPEDRKWLEALGVPPFEGWVLLKGTSILQRGPGIPSPQTLERALKDQGIPTRLETLTQLRRLDPTNPALTTACLSALESRAGALLRGSGGGRSPLPSALDDEAWGPYVDLELQLEGQCDRFQHHNTTPWTDSPFLPERSEQAKRLARAWEGTLPQRLRRNPRLPLWGLVYQLDQRLGTNHLLELVDAFLAEDGVGPERGIPLAYALARDRGDQIRCRAYAPQRLTLAQASLAQHGSRMSKAERERLEALIREIQQDLAGR